MSKFYNCDCLEAMKDYPDNYFDLAIVDPPYGDAGTEFKGNGGSRFGGRFEKHRQIERRGGGYASKYGNAIESWDVAPPAEYFEELFRISKNQIIWGG